jgi:YaiO family outer membrane protein
VVLLGLLALGAAAAAPPARAAALIPGHVVGLEVGASVGRFTIDPPWANGQFARVTIARPDDWSATGSLGRSERFGDVSIDAGGSFTKTLRPGLEGTLGLSGGTGDFIAPRYRFDASLRTSLLLPDRSLIATGGYTRIQSKGENSSHGLNGGLAWYLAGHWLFGAGFIADWGQPGDTFSPSYSLSATYFEWKRWSVGSTVRWGRVAYTLVGPTTSLVDYPTYAVSASGSWWRTDHDGFSADVEYADNDFYIGRTLTVRWFREWR